MRAFRYLAAVGVVTGTLLSVPHVRAQVPVPPPPTPAQLIELARAALQNGQALEAELHLAQALATLRRERLAEQAPRNPSGQATTERSEGMPLRIGGEIAEPKKLRDVKPVYPAIAEAAAVSGIVILEIVVDTEGAVSDARVLRSVALLDEAALDAVRQWRYTPTLLNGVPTPVIMTVTVNFQGRG